MPWLCYSYRNRNRDRIPVRYDCDFDPDSDFDKTKKTMELSNPTSPPAEPEVFSPELVVYEIEREAANMHKIILLGCCFLGLLGGRDTHAQPMSLVIGIDGMGFGEYGFSTANTPIMDSLIDGTWIDGYHGAYSDQAFAGGILDTPTEQATSSGPSWSTIHTAVWVDQHNVPNNSFSNPDYSNNPSYLETLEENVAGLHSASIVNWSPIDTHIIATVADGNSRMNFRSTPGDDSNVTNAVVSHIATIGEEIPAAIFVHFDEVDGAGHSWGNSSPLYAAEIEEKDGQVEQMLAALSTRPNFSNEQWQIIIVADHGHQPSGGHGGQSALERTVPLIIASQSLTQGNLPTVFPQAASIADVAPTVLDHFGLAIPENYYGVSRAAGALVGNADINGDGQVAGDGSGTFEDDDVVAFVSLWLQPNTVVSPNPADFNFDGIADIADWGILNGFEPALGGSIMAALSAATVPEAGTLVLALATATMLSMRPGRRRPC
jgi:type I phosphodiesterase/nucleotide pyrophosphatase